LKSFRTTFLTGTACGCLALGLDYLGHELFKLPLLPEQAGYLLLKVLPLPVFEAVLRALTVLARPLLLVGVTVGVALAYGVGALLVERIIPQAPSIALAFLVLVVSGGLGVIAAAPGDSTTLLLLELVLLAGVVPVAYAIPGYLARPPQEKEGRRELLRNLFYGAITLSVLGIAYADLRRFMSALATRQGDRAATEITPVSDFYVVSKNIGGDPVVDAGSWRLQLPDMGLTYQQLLALPSRRIELTLECISNEVGGTLISNGLWQGPTVTQLITSADVPKGTDWLLIESADGYTESFPLRELTEDHLLATHLNGAPLTPAHGFPARLIFPGHYGMKQPKWVTRLRLSAVNQRGYWEKNGWDEKAVVKTMSRIDSPLDGSAVASGTITFTGIAFAGSRRISQVELSLDGGKDWRRAELQAEFSPYSWRFWRLAALLRSGHYGVMVRAVDGSGNVQTSRPAPTLPNGADGLHAISLDVR
jgi:DMSO/TMAO reductase YedYZ molybdopterin-dependent catalytic subunit